MPLQIEPSIAKYLPMMIKEPLSKMPTEKQALFVEEYKKQCKSNGLMIALAILFPIQLFLLGKSGLGIAYWFTFGGMGVWWVVEIFLTPKRVSDFNGDVGMQIMRDMKLMAS